MASSPFAASVALIDRDKVLLIARARAPYFGMWTLPGGRLEVGETAEQCATREVHEELGIHAFALRPVMQLGLGDRGTLRLSVFATEGFEGEIIPSDEVSDWRWARYGDVDALNTTPHLPTVLERAFRMFDRS